jgi:hypothetical protein
LLHGVLGEFQFFGDGFDGLMLAIKQDERLAINFGNLFE